MEALRIILKIPCGYRIKAKKKTADLYAAYKYLNTRKHYRRTAAARLGDLAEIMGHVICCPFCGKDTPAYQHCLYGGKPTNSRRSEAELLKWVDLQTSLFGGANSILHFQQPVSLEEKFTCKRCGRVSDFSDKEMEVSIENKTSCILVEHSISSIGDIAHMKWLSHTDTVDLLGARERIVFDLDSGKTFIQLINEAGKTVHSSDLTEYDEMTKCSMLTALISEKTVVKRKIRCHFQQHWTSPIPFTVNEISICKFVLTARFIDLPQSFYDAFPFEKSSDNIDGSFLSDFFLAEFFPRRACRR